MYSRDHAVVSLLVAVAVVLAVDVGVPPAAAVAWGVAVGVGIDADHFLVARATTGDWRALRRALADPRLVLFDQSALFESDEVRPHERLLSHVLLAGPLTGGAWLVGPGPGLLTALVLYAHLVADLAWDTYRHADRGRSGDGDGQRA